MSENETVSRRAGTASGAVIIDWRVLVAAIIGFSAAIVADNLRVSQHDADRSAALVLQVD